MEQFSLDKWLQDKSRKVVTRDGREVEIIHTNSPVPHHPIVGFINKSIYTWTIDGKLIYGKEEPDRNDLFFADEEKDMIRVFKSETDEEPETIVIPFGAKDSEFISGTYTIPEGCKARIEGNKVIIEKIKREDELTEFEKCFVEEAENVHVDILSDDYTSAKESCKKLLNIAMKEFEKQGNQNNLLNFDEAEKEKNDFVSGQFIECRKSFNEFKELESYWLEYVGDDTYIGRSDNILNQRFHITPQQLFTLFTHEHCKKYYENQSEQKSSWSEEDEKLTEFEKEVKDLMSSCCNEIGEDDITNELAKEVASNLLDLARKELQLEFKKELDKAYKTADNVQYQNGKQDALKDLPKWKKTTENKEFDKHILLFEDEDRVVLTTELYKDEYYIELDDLKILPKEE